MIFKEAEVENIKRTKSELRWAERGINKINIVYLANLNMIMN